MSTIVLNRLMSTETAIASAPLKEQWYALYTRSRHEKAVAALLQQKGLTTFLPLFSQVHRWSDRRKTVQVSLFPGYTFVRLDATPESCVRILQTPGVVGFVGTGHRGIPIPDKQIEDIQTVLAQNIPCAIFPFLRVGQRVRIRGGCLDGIEGRLLTLKGDRSLVISVEPILHSLAIRLDGYDVEILPPNEAVA
ncbi:MAG: UpxY family transcription antiterminator [Candidatus Acidiferrum sp.]